MSVPPKPLHLSVTEIEGFARTVMAMVDQTQSTEERKRERQNAVSAMLRSTSAAPLATDAAVVGAFDSLMKKALIDGSALGVAACINIFTKMGAITTASPADPTTLN